MPTWQIDIEKQAISSGVPVGYFTNVYHVDAASIAAAQAIADAIVLIEKAIFANVHLFVKYRVQETNPVAHSGYLTPLSGVGSRTISGDYLPLFNCVRVDLFPATGRPSRKYLRLFVQESEQANGQLTSGFVTSVNTAYTNPLLATTGLCDPQGQPFIRAVTNPLVAMRQLRRGSRRQLRPVL